MRARIALALSFCLSLAARKTHANTAAAAKDKHLLVSLDCCNDFFQRL